MKTCFLYPGQGAQFPGMARDLWEESNQVKDLFTLASDITGWDMKKLLFDGPAEELSRTDKTQPAITLANAAVKIFLAQRGIVSRGCAGFSLGEYAALEDAGVLSLEDLFRLVTLRGDLMHQAGERFGSGDDAPGMAAVIGLTADQIDGLFPAGTEDVFPANYNAPNQIVLAGTAAGLGRAEGLCKEAGARRFLRLKVSGPFHSPLLDEARKEFAEAVRDYDFKDPQKIVYSHVTGRTISSGDEARDLAIAQVTSPVRWVEEVTLISQGGYDTIVETGPGKVLTGLWKSAALEPACLPCGTTGEIQALIGD